MVSVDITPLLSGNAIVGGFCLYPMCASYRRESGYLVGSWKVQKKAVMYFIEIATGVPPLNDEDK